jgi:hypothetical protein
MLHPILAFHSPPHCNASHSFLSYLFPGLPPPARPTFCSSRISFLLLWPLTPLPMTPKSNLYSILPSPAPRLTALPVCWNAPWRCPQGPRSLCLNWSPQFKCCPTFWFLWKHCLSPTHSA